MVVVALIFKVTNKSMAMVCFDEAWWSKKIDKWDTDLPRDKHPKFARKLPRLMTSISDDNSKATCMSFAPPTVQYFDDRTVLGTGS